ncbi:MAG: MFS transporter [Thermoleophilia bacterium]
MTSEPEPPGGGERAILWTVALATVLAPLNSTIIAVALPAIRDDLEVSVARASWLVTAYLISVAALQPVAGKLGDRLGRRQLLLGGLLASGACSLGAALAPSFDVLLAFRIGQAVAGAFVVPNGIALIRETLPAARRGRGFGMIGGAASLAAAVGPPLGGALTDAAGWRSTFYLSLPIVAVSLLLAARAIPARAGARRTADAPLDVRGIAALLASMGLLGTTIGLAEHGDGPAAIGSGVGAALLFGAFLRIELAQTDPVLPLGVFRRRAFSSAAGAIALSNLAMYVTLLTVPLVLAVRPGHADWETGVVLMALSGPSALLAPVGGRLADRFGRRLAPLVGLSAMTLGLVPLAIDPDLGPGALAACLAIAGAGPGLAGAGLQAAAVEAVHESEVGAAAGLSSTSRYVGSIVGSIALATLLVEEADRIQGDRAVLVIVVVGAALSALCTLGLPGLPRAGLGGSPAPARPGSRAG